MTTYTCASCRAVEHRHGDPKYGGKKKCRSCGGTLRGPGRPAPVPRPVVERESTGWLDLDAVARLDGRAVCEAVAKPRMPLTPGAP